MLRMVKIVQSGRMLCFRVYGKTRILLCKKMDTWVVAVNSAVVQDEWDAVQVSHLKGPGKEK